MECKIPTCKTVTNPIQTRNGKCLTEESCEGMVAVGETVILQDNKLEEKIENKNVHGKTRTASILNELPSMLQYGFI